METPPLEVMRAVRFCGLVRIFFPRLAADVSQELANMGLVWHRCRAILHPNGDVQLLPIDGGCGLLLTLEGKGRFLLNDYDEPGFISFDANVAKWLRFEREELKESELLTD